MVWYEQTAMSDTNQYTLPPPPLVIDPSTVARLIEISKKPILSARDIFLILDLGLPPTMRRALELTSRAQNEKVEVDKLIAREQDPIKKLLLKASLLQDEDIRILAAADLTQLIPDDGYVILCARQRGTTAPDPPLRREHPCQVQNRTVAKGRVVAQRSKTWPQNK